MLKSEKKKKFFFLLFLLRAALAMLTTFRHPAFQQSEEINHGMYYRIDGLAKVRCSSSANALEFPLSWSSKSSLPCSEFMHKNFSIKIINLTRELQRFSSLVLAVHNPNQFVSIERRLSVLGYCSLRNTIKWCTQITHMYKLNNVYSK